MHKVTDYYGNCADSTYCYNLFFDVTNFVSNVVVTEYE